MFIDTHCHIFKEYYDDIEEMIKRLNFFSISGVIVSGCNHFSNQEVLDLVSNFVNVYGTLGVHPEEVNNYSISQIDFIEKHLCTERIIAIGEIGLDYHYTKENKNEQKKLFEKQLTLADKYSLPVVIHSRDATEDTISILKKYPHVKGVIHSFSGSLETALIYIKMGYKLGINGVVTFKNCNLKDILPDIYQHIVLETDSPYLSPQPYRGQKNEPKNVKIIADFVAEICQISLEELSRITYHNIQEVFDISI